MDKMTETRAYKSNELKQDNIKQIFRLVKTALNERGYNTVNQLVGYLISNDPAYISNHKNARSVVQSVPRDEILEELVRYYLEDIE